MQVMQVNTQAARRGGRLDYKWILAMVVIFGVFMSILDQTIVNIAIPRLQSAFGADIHSVQWVLTAYILAQGVATPAAAFFADTLYSWLSALWAGVEPPYSDHFPHLARTWRSCAIPALDHTALPRVPPPGTRHGYGYLRCPRAACPGPWPHAWRVPGDICWLASHLLRQRPHWHCRHRPLHHPYPRIPSRRTNAL